MSRIRADQLVNRAGSGGPKFPHGVAEGFSVSGVVTATSFAGNVTGDLTGTVTGNADSATTATNAQGLTGTPNITVQNATVQGNLTVNGTTTTIDTAVTAVDSLQVNGQVLAGTNSSINFIGGTTATLQTINTSTQYALGMERATNDTAGPVCVFRKTRSTSNGGNTIVSSGDDLGYIRFAGTDGAAAVTSAEIRAQVDGTPGSGDMPGTLIFGTTSDGASSVTERLRITSTGKLEAYKGTSTTGKTSGSEAFTVGNGAGNKRFSVYPDGTAVIGGQGTIANNNILLQNDGQGTFSNTVRVDHSGNAGSNQLARLGNVNNSGTNSAHLFLANGYYVSPTDVDGTAAAAKILADGTIHDSIGPLRRLGIVSSSVDLTLSAASHAGRLIRMTSTNRTFTIPSGSFSSGDMITIFHVGTGNMTIAQGSSVTLYNAADGATGNRTLAAKGMVTIACTDGPSNEFVISGTQLS